LIVNAEEVGVFFLRHPESPEARASIRWCNWGRWFQMMIVIHLRPVLRKPQWRTPIIVLIWWIRDWMRCLFVLLALNNLSSNRVSFPLGVSFIRSIPVCVIPFWSVPIQ
jgi:hypothetical protein